MNDMKLLKALPGMDGPCFFCGETGCDLIAQENKPGGNYVPLHSTCLYPPVVNRYARIEIMELDDQIIVWVQRWGRVNKTQYFISEESASYSRLVDLLSEFDQIPIPEDSYLEAYEAMPEGGMR